MSLLRKLSDPMVAEIGVYPIPTALRYSYAEAKKGA